MTERLYHQDSKLNEFTANILKVKHSERGIEICLDQSAFYPTSGGQPHDTGSINGIMVDDVWEAEGEIWHLVKIMPELKNIKGLINWKRRFDHMQHHTGQHLLSAVVFDELQANTIGFHIGSEIITIDLDIASLTESQVDQIENLTNQLIWQNLPVLTRFIDGEERNAYHFRKPPTISGRIRIVQIGNFDCSACGGTHVNSTGEIGQLKINAIERYKGGVRLSFVCGKRSLNQHQRAWTLINQAATSLSVHPDDLPETVKKLSEDIKRYRSEIFNLTQQLLAIEAEKAGGEASKVNGVKQIYFSFEDRALEELRLLGKILRQYPNTIAFLASNIKGSTHLYCSKSPDIEILEMSQILKEVTVEFGGKGGGSQDVAEGGLPPTDPTVIFNHIRVYVETQIKQSQ